MISRVFFNRRRWLAAAALTATTSVVARGQTDPASTADDGSAVRIREGRRIGPVVGEVVQLANRWAFRPEANSATDQIEATLTSPICLENLMLGRVVASIQRDPADRFWTITATVTEFGGANYLLLTAAQRAASVDQH